ncbi:hypothetical protein GCM10022254_00520 [Actinomadura meridiana]|uniref:Uncharacterized protein n=1 Tax=Actinomadura meridiana TaxID=559626 RepID=A0ABP8BR64_9ACTN
MFGGAFPTPVEAVIAVQRPLHRAAPWQPLRNQRLHDSDVTVSDGVRTAILEVDGRPTCG